MLARPCVDAGPLPIRCSLRLNLALFRRFVNLYSTMLKPSAYWRIPRFTVCHSPGFAIVIGMRAIFAKTHVLRDDDWLSEGNRHADFAGLKLG